MVEIALRDACVFQGLLKWDPAAFDEVRCHLLKLRTRQCLVEVKWPISICGDEREVDLRRLHLAEFNLCLLGRFLEPLHRHAIARKIDTLSVLELGDEPVDHPLVPVVTAEARIAVG